MTDIVMPYAGEGVTHGTVVSWNCRPGDPVLRGEVLVEVMTDKISMEVECLHDGTLVEIIHGADEEVRVGTVIGRIEVQ